MSSYDVGYGKPPKGTQFQKGQSGNRKGRPKHKPTPEDIVKKVFARRVTARIDGEAKKIPMREALIRRLFDLAVAGYPKAIKWMQKIQQHASSEERGGLTREEKEEWKQDFIRRLEELLIRKSAQARKGDT